jgi:hypothetical protein
MRPKKPEMTRSGDLRAQNPDDLLFFREPARLHGPSPIRGDGLYPFLEEFTGLRSLQNCKDLLLGVPLALPRPTSPSRPDSNSLWIQGDDEEFKSQSAECCGQ